MTHGSDRLRRPTPADSRGQLAGWPLGGGLGLALVGLGLLWFGYAAEIVAERSRREFVQEALTRAAAAAAEPNHFRIAVEEALDELDRGRVRLSGETALEVRATLRTLSQDAARASASPILELRPTPGSEMESAPAPDTGAGPEPPPWAGTGAPEGVLPDSTRRQVEILRLVERMRTKEVPPDRWTGRLGFLLIAAGVAWAISGQRARTRRA